MLIIILNNKIKKCDKNIDTIKHYLSGNNIIIIEEGYEYALKYAKKHHTNEPCLILQDTSVIQFNLNDQLNTLLTIDANLYFLCTWNDDCNKYTKVNGYHYLKWTTSSCADQAILFRPNARDYVLKELACKKLKYILINCHHKFKAIALIPNIVHVDFNLITSNKHLSKLNLAFVEKEVKKPSNTNNAAWIILIVLFILLLVILVPYFKNYKTLYI